MCELYPTNNGGTSVSLGGEADIHHTPRVAYFLLPIQQHSPPRPAHGDGRAVHRDARTDAARIVADERQQDRCARSASSPND
jgi:hypothetical protein